MADDKKPESSFPGSILPITAIIALISAFLFHGELPYFDERPYANPLKNSTSQAQDVDARLWQDPMAAVASYDEDSTKKLLVMVNPQGGSTMSLVMLTPVQD